MSAKDTRIHGRISMADKARWQEKADELGYRSLWHFVQDTVEESFARAAPVQERSAVIQPLGGEPKAKATPSVASCESAAKHRKGVFCKSCKKVI